MPINVISNTGPPISAASGSRWRNAPPKRPPAANATIGFNKAASFFFARDRLAKAKKGTAPIIAAASREERRGDMRGIVACGGAHAVRPYNDSFPYPLRPAPPRFTRGRLCNPLGSLEAGSAPRPTLSPSPELHLPHMTNDLTLFVKEALERGQSRDQIKGVLEQAGWKPDEVSNALQAYAEVSFPIPVPRSKPYMNAREAFLYLLLFLTLYWSSFSFGQL